MLTLAFHIGPIAFDQPLWLALVPICWVLIIWIGRQSLSGLGTLSRRAALLMRLLVVLLVIGAIAKPYWRKEAKGVNLTVVVDVSDSVHRPLKLPDGRMVDVSTYVDAYIREAAEFAKPGDTISRITVAKKAYVQSLPVLPREKPDTQTLGDTDASNLASGVAMAVAVPAKDSDQQAAAKRILVISDFNETSGSIQKAAAEAASTAKVPIDVLPLRYKFEQEVMVERVVAPSTARMGQTVTLRALITTIKPARGRLTLLVNGDPVQLGESKNEMDLPVELQPGSNIIPIPITLPFAGPQKFEAHFTPASKDDDSIEQNNTNMAITFVQSEGRVLVIAPSPEEVGPMVKALTEARLDVKVVRPDEAPKDLVDWGAFDAIVIANTSAGDISQRQQEDMRAYVHDLGGGLVMVGGPESFGAGGWIGSPVADALPIKLDPPQQRKMPRGALVLLMHSCEMPRGNYWGQQVALAAVNNLSRMDMAGVLEFSFAKGDWWVHPLSEVGNKAAITRAINSLTFGDMPTFDKLLQMAHDDLVKVAAGAKHVIIISDGDPQIANRGILDDCLAAKISISTVLVYPHNRTPGAQGGDWETMRMIAKRTKGRFYPIIDEGDFAKLPGIFIKEAQVVKRSLIWEGDPFAPTIVNAVSEPMRGLTAGGVPPISGYIVAAEREGLSVVTLRGKENDPILAHWQYGLGKSVAFTSDASTKWTTAWPSWGKYRAFWEQHIRWAMRPGGNADMRISTEQVGDKTKVIVEALDAKGERLNFVRFAGRAAGPNGSSQPVELRQVGPGRYEGTIDSASSGAYVMNIRYLSPNPDGPGQSREGNIQAAVTRPFADEFKTLQDNAPLGKLVAEITGGRVVDQNPALADLWLRKDLKMPVDQRPIWIVVALISIGAFLFDVAVRRIRIDPQLIAASVRKGMGQGATQAGQQLGGLKEARQRAQQSISKPGAPAQVAAVKPGPVDAGMAKTKFEVSDDVLKKSRTNEAVADLSTPEAGARPSGTGLTEQTGEKITQDQGLSRLKKARERAQEKFEDEEPPQKS